MKVPGYTEIRELGHGATGRVMLAVRDSDGAHVAIKYLSARLREDGEFLERFRAEASVIQELDSPHTARLLDYVEDTGEPAIVMELVDGIPLRRLLRQEGGTGPQAALSVLKGSLLGLAEAHRHAIVHRDFKPENVIVTDEGGSKLVDFGLAAPAGERAPLIGTPSYMAPEQWDGALAGPSADIYAATVVFYECLTGRRPFTADDVAALAHQHRHAEPALDGVEEEVRGLVRRGLAKDPADRPESAEAFLAELEETATEEYGRRWDVRGRARLAALTVPFLMTRPLARTEPETGTALFQSSFTPAKAALTGGLVLATAGAVVSVFLIWNETPPPQDRGAFPPAALATSRAPTPGPTSASPSGTPAPSATSTGGSPDPAGTVHPTRGPGDRAPERETGRTSTPTRSDSTRDPTQGRPTRTPAEPTASRPTRTPADPAPDRPTRTPPPTPAPDPATTPPPTRTPEPLVSVSISVSLGVPVLGGGGDGLLDAEAGLGVGSRLLGGGE